MDNNDNIMVVIVVNTFVRHMNSCLTSTTRSVLQNLKICTACNAEPKTAVHTAPICRVLPSAEDTIHHNNEAKTVHQRNVN